MFTATLAVSGGSIAQVLINGAWESGQRWELRGKSEEALYRRAIEIVSAWKFKRHEDRIEEVDTASNKVHGELLTALQEKKPQVSLETQFDPYDESNVYLTWHIEMDSPLAPILEIVPEGTPSASWFRSGEKDPHGQGYAEEERSKLALGRLTDDQLANAVFLHDHRSLDLEAVLRGEPSSIGLLTAAKERIRWLSRRTQWPTANIKVFGDDEILKEVSDAAGSRQFLISLALQMEWNCLTNGVFADEEYVAFDVNGIIVDADTGETESVSVHDPRVTQWAVYGRVSDTTAFAMHDCDSLEDALVRAALLAKIYQ